MNTTRDQCVVFDLGGVLVDPSPLMGRLAAILDVPADTFEAAYWVRRLEYDLELSALDYWRDVLARLRLSETPSQIASLIDVDSDAWTAARPEAATLLERLHARGTRLVILSNATKEMGRAARRSPWAQYISEWFFSAEVGLAKPDPAIYHHVARSLNADASDLHYFEDSRKAVDAAAASGWNAHLWQSQAAAEALLRSHGFLDAGELRKPRRLGDHHSVKSRHPGAAESPARRSATERNR